MQSERNPEGGIPLPQLLTLIAAEMGDQWQCDYASGGPGQPLVSVWQRGKRLQDTVVVATEASLQGSRPVDLAGVGRFWVYSLLDDPRLPLRALFCDIPVFKGDIEVLRYRPGKRLTLRAVDGSGVVFYKILAKPEAHQIAGRFRAVHDARAELQFRAADAWTPALPAQSEGLSSQIFAMSNVPGRPVLPLIKNGHVEYAAGMAAAVSSLHASRAAFDARFDHRDQQLRTLRYLQGLLDSAPQVQELVGRFQLSSAALLPRFDANPLVPIHGSLHGHQWLLDEGNAGDPNYPSLGLIDFDRASLGHAENDLGTFLADWDYENSRVGVPVNQTFLLNVGNFDEALMLYYRAHKHVSKAYKIARSSKTDRVRRVAQAMSRANELLEAIGS